MKTYDSNWKIRLLAALLTAIIFSYKYLIDASQTETEQEGRKECVDR